MRSALLSLSVLGFIGLLAFSSPGTTGSASSLAPEQHEFTIDPVHSSLHFKVMHNNASWFYGRFGDLSGTFVLDKDPARCSLQVEVGADTVDTRNDKLDQHLRSPDFFDAKQFPKVRFASTKVESESPGMYLVTGDLSLHGVTKTLTIEVEQVGASEGRYGPLVGYHSRFVIDRADFGMTYGLGGPLGSDVELTVSIEAGQR